MPNWCYNNVKISFDLEGKEQLQDAVESGEENFFNTLVPRPADEEENWYDWNVSNWGTKWDTKPFDVEWEDDCVRFKLETAWGPPITFYETIENMGYSVEAYYLEEGMAFVGQYENGFNDHYEYGNMSADEMEEQLPEWADEQFGVISMQRDREEEEQYEIEEEPEPVYEMTEWFDKKTKPMREGVYEVKTKDWAWPFPQKAYWKGEWRQYYGDDQDIGSDKLKIESWRGLAEDPYSEEDLEEALEELKKEFEALTAEK